MTRWIVAGLLAVTIGGISAAMALHSEPDRFTTLSNVGRAGKTDGFEPIGPVGYQATQSIGAFLLARRGDYEFFRMSLADGTSCWGAKKSYSSEEGVMSRACQRESGFPSRARPLLDYSTLEQTDESYPRLIRLAGFAADGVAQIAVIDPDNRLVPAVPVEDNVYFTEQLPQGDFFGLAALDRDGDIVWRNSPVE